MENKPTMNVAAFTPEVIPEENLDFIKNMKIGSISDRRERELYNEKRLGIQSEQDKVQQEKAYKYPTVMIPATADYGYPNSIQNLSVNMDDFMISKMLDSIVTTYNTGYLYAKALFTKFILEYDFDIFTTSSGEETEGACALASSCEKMDLKPKGSPKKGLRENKILMSDQTILSSEKVKFKYRVTGDCVTDRSCITLAVQGENPPICILTGDDEYIKPTSEILPPFMIAHTINKNDVKKKIQGYINVNRLSKEFRDSEYCDLVLYYWSRNVINLGYVYWLMEEGETLHLYDLTAPLKMKPLKWNRDDKILKKCRHDYISSSVALLYFNVMKKLYDEDTVMYYSEIMELGERVIGCIERCEYPIEFCQANIMLSNTLIPIGTKIDDPEVMVSQDGYPNELRRVTNQDDVYVELKVVTNMSVSFLQRALELLSQRMYEKGRFPLVTGDVPHGSSSSHFDFNKLLSLLSKDKIEVFEPKNYETTVMKPFIDKKDYELKLIVVILRKLFHDCIIEARMSQMRLCYALAAMRCDLALTAWVTMGAILTKHCKPKKAFYLPIRPLYLFGEIFYDITRKEERKINFFNYYKGPAQQAAWRTITTLISVTDCRCVRDFDYIHDKTRVLISSFNCLAAAILFAGVKPERVLLERFCVVTNHIAYNLVNRSKDLLYTDLLEAQSNLKLSDRVIEVALHYSTKFFGHSRQVHFAAQWMKAYYWRTDVDHSVVHRGALYDRIEEDFNKAFAILEKMHIISTQTQAKVDVPVAEDVNRKEILDTIVEKIWRLKQWENQDSKSYHKKILPLFEWYIKECKIAIPTSGRTIYFQYKCAVGCASLAECLLGLFRDSRNENILDKAEYWFMIATERFNNVIDDTDHTKKPTKRYCEMEILKTISDRITLYEFAIDSIRAASPYDERIIKALMEINETLNTLLQYRWDERDSDHYKELKRVALCGVMQAVEKRMQNALVRRRKLVADGVIIDLPRECVSKLFCESMNLTRKPLFTNVVSILDEIRATLNSLGLP